MTTQTDDSRLGVLEGRIAEQSVTLQEVQQDLRQVNARIDRLFLAMMGIGVAQIGLMITLIITLLIRT